MQWRTVIIYTWDLSTKIVHPTRCSMYTLADASYILWRISSLYLSRSQDRWKWAPLIYLNSYIICSSVTLKYCITIIRVVSWLMIGAMKKLPASEIWKSKETTSNVIVITKWKMEEDVSLCHRLTKVVNSWLSSMVSEQSTSRRRLHSLTIAFTCGGISASENFFNSNPLVGTLGRIRSCNKQSKKHQLISKYH